MSNTPPAGGVPGLSAQQPSSMPPPSLPPRAEPSPSDPSLLVLVPAQPPLSPPLVSRPSFEYQPIRPLAPGQLPRGMTEVSPWGRLGAYLLESVLISSMVLIPWLALAVLDVDEVLAVLIYLAQLFAWSIWALALGTGGQTPAKRLLGHTVIAADTHQPVGLGRMIWVRGVLGGILAPIAIICTLGILLFMPFWNKHNQNIWDRISNCYVVHRP